MKRTLGLDLGTNSIGWALVNLDFSKNGAIEGIGARIIPMSQDKLSDFGKGNSVSQTAERTKFRSSRRLRERHLLRRQRLLRVLNVLGFLPEHFQSKIDFDKRLGQFFENEEPKIAYNNSKFIFESSFHELVELFRKKHPELLSDGKKIPYDWTIYYIRTKALKQAVSKQELAWILLHFNQKRGYYLARGEEEIEKLNQRSEYYSLKVLDVKADLDNKGAKGTWYSVVLENDLVYRRQSTIPLNDWIGKVKEFIITTELNEDGSEKTDKEGKIKRSFRAPSEGDWTLLKKKSENEIDQSGGTVGEYILNQLLNNPKIKIKGKLIRTIERKYYREELEKILTKQAEFHTEFKDNDLFNDCIRELYKSNDAHRTYLESKDLTHLFLKDIIFYQRPLKSKKGLIAHCPLESGSYLDQNVVQIAKPIKCIPKSNPYYQEFRIWQWIFNLSIYRTEDDKNLTEQFIPNLNIYTDLFDFINSKKEIKQEQVIKFLLELSGMKGKELREAVGKYRWNYVQDKIYPGNETQSQIITRLIKAGVNASEFLTNDKEYHLWHIIYSVHDKSEFIAALKSFARKNNLNVEAFADAFQNHPPYKSDFGAYSEKAIKKLLPLLRAGKYWDWDTLDPKTKSRIDKIITGELDDTLKDKVREHSEKHQLQKESDFQGLPLWLAQYVVYGRHSEASLAGKWKSASELDAFIHEFKQHSLRNPIVEQIVLESLRVVRDIWNHYGKGAENFFDEIHIELGRDLKNPKDERDKMTRQINENENTNLRIKALLAEMAQDQKVESVRPYSPVQQEILKIYENGVLSSGIEIDDDILKISRTAQPSSSDLKKYKLWLEQKYRSPYTGAIIPLNKLFTTNYEIEHIIPQSRYFDDSFSNKVICEAAVNKLKDNQLALEFIKNHGGQIVKTGFGKEVKIFTREEFEEFVKQNYAQNRSKKAKLVMEDIPDKMVESQLNDTRYISKYISSILSNIVRSDTNDDGVNSKNLVFVNGKITGELKQDWGLNDVWNDLILPRFIRLNQLLNTDKYTAWSEKHQKYIPAVPLEESKGFSKKRIDHRHHAMDALVIACATRDHVNLLNNINAKSATRNDLIRKLKTYKEVTYTDNQTGQIVKREIPDQFIKPWSAFTRETAEALEEIVVSFKQNLRIINKSMNRYTRWELKEGKLTKVQSPQKGTTLTIRKSLHQDYIYGLVQLNHLKTNKDEILTARRKPLDTKFNLNTIESITDTGIQKILRNFLKFKDNNPELAFTPEGIEDMNRNIRHFNDGKDHQPIEKVRVFESGKKFPLGINGSKKKMFVQSDKGANLFFAVFTDNLGNRNFATIPLSEVIERLKQNLNPAPDLDENGNKLSFFLSPEDLVYVPNVNELSNSNMINFNRLTIEQRNRLFNVNNFSNTCYFRPNRIAQSIIAKEVDYKFNRESNKLSGSYDIKTASFEEFQIKDVCIKLKIDRLGFLSEK